MICETPDCGQVALSVLTTTCGRFCLCGSCIEQIWGIETQKDEVSRAIQEVSYVAV